MARTYLRVSSVTNAMRGKTLLERNGIRASVSRTLEEDGSNGCGYSVVVWSDPERSAQILRGAGIRVRGMKQGPDWI